jgi:hypothetical protein
MNADPTNVQASMSYVISVRWSGDLLKLMGDRSGALTKYRIVLEILERLSVTQPANIMVRGRQSEMLILTVRLLAEKGALEQARATTSRGLAMARELASRPDATPDDLSQYALDFLTCEPPDLRRPATALRYAEESVAKSGGTDSDSLDVLAQAYFQKGDFAHAIEARKRCCVFWLRPGPTNLIRRCDAGSNRNSSSSRPWVPTPQEIPDGDADPARRTDQLVRIARVRREVLACGNEISLSRRRALTASRPRRLHQ